MDKHRRMTQLLLGWLAPGVPQEQRNELRKLFTPFAKETARKETARKENPGSESGNPALE